MYMHVIMMWSLTNLNWSTSLLEVIGSAHYQKKDKKGVTSWKLTQFRHLLWMTIEIFDLIDIQRARYPNLNTYSYVSKASVKSRLDFILIAKNLSKFVKSTGIKASIAPDHKTVHLCLSWPNNSPRGPGVWKFNNTLLKDENYRGEICKLIFLK